ncbi:pilus assembly protein TadG-related protein [Desulfobacca acetoxidans]
MKDNLGRHEEGAIAVITALLLPVMIGFTGLAIDIGNLYVIKTRMQSAVDAAVCGGGLKLPNQGLATTTANSFITNNGFDPNDATITYTQDTVNNPAGSPEINCSMTNQVPTFFLGLFGYPNVSITVSAKGILQTGGAGGPFNYAIFSDQNLPISGNQKITGSVHTNHQLTISGNTKISGAAEGATGVCLSGSNTIGSVQADTTANIHVSGSNTIGSQSGGATQIAMPDFTSQIEAAAQAQGTVYYSAKILSGTNDLDGNIWVQGDITMSGMTTSGTGAILANGNITISGNTTIGGNGQVCLYSANGNITVSGSFNNGSNGSEIIYAPNGSVTISGNSTINGCIVAKRIVISGNLTVNGNYTVASVPLSNNHVKLIQ